MTSWNPLFVRGWRRRRSGVRIDGRPTRYTFVSPEYFTAAEIPDRARPRVRADEAQTYARVAIVSDATARAFWPGANPIGQTDPDRPAHELTHGRTEGYTDVTVVGTVRDVVTGIMVDGPDRGHIYLPTPPPSTVARRRCSCDRGRREISGPTWRSPRFAAPDYDPAIWEVFPMTEMRDAQMYPLRAGAWIGGLLGAVALALSVSGLYGVLSYMLTQRTREIGIRIALGATARGIIDLVVRQSSPPGRRWRGGRASYWLPPP